MTPGRSRDYHVNCTSGSSASSAGQTSPTSPAASSRARTPKPDPNVATVAQAKAAASFKNPAVQQLQHDSNAGLLYGYLLLVEHVKAPRSTLQLVLFMRQRRRAVDDRRHPDSMSHSVRTSTERTPPSRVGCVRRVALLLGESQDGLAATFSNGSKAAARHVGRIRLSPSFAAAASSTHRRSHLPLSEKELG